MSAERVILLLGRKDEPTDGVRDYCENLREAGASRGISFELAQIPWAEKGWRAALAELRRLGADWRDRWVFLQYTTLAWSRRGFPLRAPSILQVLLRCGARPGVVLHDSAPQPGNGPVGYARQYCHLRVLRQLYRHSELVISTVPVNKLDWLPLRRERAVFIPVGANCPEASTPFHSETSSGKTVAVYGVTGGEARMREVADLAAALRHASRRTRPIQLLLLGRGSQDAEPALRTELAGADVAIKSFGLLPPADVTNALAKADVLLFVRGQISTRRGSAIAGIACGLPVVCYSGPETSWPITEAGILAVPLHDQDALANALDAVLTDDEFRKALAERSRQALRKHFSWSAIAEQFKSVVAASNWEKSVELSKKTSGAAQVA